MSVDQLRGLPMFDAPFDGATYDDERDRARLTRQIDRVYNALRCGRWLTVNEIHDLTGDPHNSIQTQCRNLRKAKHGGHTVPSRPRGGSGETEYHLTPNRTLEVA